MSQSRHPSSRRRASEEKKEAEDVFVEKTLELIQWAKDNSQILILAGIVLVVVVAGTIYYTNYRTSWQEQAVARLEQVQNSFAFGDRETAEADLYQYLEQFEGTVYALEARLVLGQALLEDGTPEESIEVLAPAVREMSSQPIGIQAGFLLAAAYEEAGRDEDAEELFIRIGNTTDLNFQVREALAGAARLRMKAGDTAGAAELFEDIIATYEEGDPNLGFWEMRLAEVSSPQ
ncbi:MAG: tetratricopeptide repeat protein [Gemmatimonadota bacterium]|jgi:predicted negative regulator of RcsB-dependent stress response